MLGTKLPGTALLKRGVAATVNKKTDGCCSCTAQQRGLQRYKVLWVNFPVSFQEAREEKKPTLDVRLGRRERIGRVSFLAPVAEIWRRALSSRLLTIFVVKPTMLRRHR